MFVYICIVYVYMCVYIYIYVYIYICMCLCVCVYGLVCVCCVLFCFEGRALGSREPYFDWKAKPGSLVRPKTASLNIYIYIEI